MSNEWIENTRFAQPVGNDVLVDVKLDGVYDPYFDGDEAEYWEWKKLDTDCITHWRLHKPEITLDDAFDEPDSVHWTEALKYPESAQVQYEYPDTKPINPPKKSAEQLAIDVLYNTTGKLYTEREIIAITTIVAQIKNLENV